MAPGGKKKGSGEDLQLQMLSGIRYAMGMPQPAKIFS